MYRRIVLFGRLLRDGRVPRHTKLLLALLAVYLAVPFDLVPDFIPVAGQLDDAVLVAPALRRVVRSGGRRLVEEHRPGPEASLNLVLRLPGIGDPRIAPTEGGSGRLPPARRR